MFFVKKHGALKGRGCIEGNPGTSAVTEFGFDIGKQQRRYPSTVPRGANRHPADVAFPLSDDVASDGTDDLARIGYGNEHAHRCQTTTYGPLFQHRVNERIRRVAIAKGRKSFFKTLQDGQAIADSRLAD
jgi:hypothetical protein